MPDAVDDDLIAVPAEIDLPPHEPSPFRPGESPSVVAGRTTVRGHVARVVNDVVAGGGSGRVAMLVGARGTGKTTLCDWLIESRAWAMGWVGLSLRGDLRQGLAGQVATSWRVATGARESKRTTKVGVQVSLPALVSLSAEFVPASAATPVTLLDALRRPLETLRDAGTGLLLVVDEAQAAPADQLAEVVQLLEQGHGRESLPIGVVLAGTTRLARRVLSSGVAGSLGMLARGERIDLTVGQSFDDTAAMLAATLDQVGARITSGAAQAIFERTGGYPHAVQVYGANAYDAAVRRVGGSPDRVIGDDVTTSIERSYVDLVPALASFWEREAATGPQPVRAQEYLATVAALVADQATATHAIVCDRLGVPQTARSRELGQLVDRGIVVRSDGVIRLAIGDMVRFALERSAA
jgi:type II secretory pathway predicted ATPase ExeA